MAMTLWVDSSSGERLDHGRLCEWRRRARALYAVNSHIFEDELDALTALGVVPFVSDPSHRELPQPVEVSHDDRSTAGRDQTAAAQ
jgi:hypothetical protein